MTATPTPGAAVCTAAVCDGHIKKLNAASSVLSGVSSEVKTINLHVRNQGSQTETFGIYIDVVPPGGTTNPFGCAPSGRVLSTTLVIAPSNQDTNVIVTPTFSCANHAGAVSLSYTIKAAIDVHADDEGVCGVSQINSVACFNGLADDDDDDTDNRITKNAFQVKPP